MALLVEPESREFTRADGAFDLNEPVYCTSLACLVSAFIGKRAEGFVVKHAFFHMHEFVKVIELRLVRFGGNQISLTIGNGNIPEIVFKISGARAIPVFINTWF